MSDRKLARYVIAGIAVVAIGGGAGYGIASAPSGSSSSTAPAGASSRPGPGGQPSNARSGPAAGGAFGTVASLSGSGFTMSTSAGQKVTVRETSTTTYRKGSGAAGASSITSGQRVVVLGTTDSSTITATEVITQPAGYSTATASAEEVVPFKRGTPTTSKEVGHIPLVYQQGSGTIMSGTTADKATAAALATYPGGIVDRVVKLSNGEYEVHNIGVNWPHHVFVNQSFTVIGAN